MRFLISIVLFYTSSIVIAQITSKEIFATIAEDTLWGNYTSPQAEKDTSQTIIILIAGSGPTDRDGNNPVMKNNSLLMLSEDLANFGFPTIRYDKRGVAKSQSAYIPEKDLTFDQNVKDAQGFYDYAKNLGYSKIVIAGHSEGSLVGILLANNNNAHKFISIAGAGRSIDKVLKEQYQNTAPIVRDSAHSILDSLVKGVKVDTLSPWLYSLFRPQIQDYLISWIKIDPAIELAKYPNPILILQGTTDIQVSLEDAETLKKGNETADLVIIEGMNHILKKAPIDRDLNKKTYTNPTLPLHPDVVFAIVNFLKK